MEPPGPEAASAMLRDLLINKTKYRQKWEVYANKKRLERGDVNYDAIGRFIKDTVKGGKTSTRENGVERPRRDKVRRALTGGPLTYETVAMFIEAFKFEECEQEELRKLFFGET